jgi:tRNA pseudouridine32 synthase/23S rRNA pseudouridine746 synthase
MKVLFADDRLVVVDKPSGLLSVPGRGANKQDCASARVQREFADALIVHRLDQATSGLLVFGRGPDWQRRLSVEFAERRVDKRYVAVVQGRLSAPDWQLIDLPLACDWPNRPRQQIDPAHGKPSQTRWRALEAGPDHSRVELEPLTGRTHQLRVHLAAIGHPIVGDALYHPEPSGSPRLLLHATELALLGRRFVSTPEF